MTELRIDPDRPVLIAGPTASGKSALALEIAEKQGGVVVNADASQVFDCWRIVTARPSAEEEARAPHQLYGHVAYDAPYSAGHWLREVVPLLSGAQRPIIVGGTGLYFSALTEGMAEIPPTPAEVRAEGDSMSLEDLLSALDPQTAARIDVQNRARVQRAWEVLTATGRALADWQDDTPPPPLPLNACSALVLESSKDWLEARIRKRFRAMLDQGAMDEVEAMRDRFDPSLPSCKAIGAPELMAYATGRMTLEEAEESAAIATRRFAKRQRTWFRARMDKWRKISPEIGYQLS
ncbi:MULTISPECIES: tRNA (adenosine(37)-N6)-dimethylallyltransferase MiaA [Rhodobacterales]|jgi:tRNA dimethylallyltransferase|uniref:tRNA (adenosine(37)-N6)-dimethylallyltransferase MiaA n=1 Tax=Rhodobacterales TaxID=204455 RepID=UPI00237F4DA8|nr:tRNA (adenosine(37)-N6)-dimethylallyltransferase MiaA [Phaeobacter gallaeciensis]MDE4139196.1 tRNA (adenosine(37)-N6)-dimethylallyltransferase MiaA [Phaeobacter gallaeciensis]MDE4147746.1 tRNA (adenosine(37)-N6)-dimethylallyltransferase MiaA [Phaeobacter gallaeciensis]MDE4151964.1 tRNA (adenosine(37)-N6)-dimethylallyltransferase MiaA [Phaeobacter gallaeciensis]MDE4227252.1 tRNA (adenosine(37)-N6)-dimethylallyltransferase MiaA [Phaeobacter gallaeciensis]MDE4256428.1 tRNA (adenosine(37)-N6)-d